MRKLAWNENTERERWGGREKEMDWKSAPSAGSPAGGHRWENDRPQEIGSVNKADGSHGKPPATLPKAWPPSLGLRVIQLGNAKPVKWYPLETCSAHTQRGRPISATGRPDGTDSGGGPLAPRQRPRPAADAWVGSSWVC